MSYPREISLRRNTFNILRNCGEVYSYRALYRNSCHPSLVTHHLDASLSYVTFAPSFSLRLMAL
jgi:hypothetical protein